MTAIRPLAAAGALGIAALVAVRLTLRIQVEGHSMAPALRHGDRLLMLRHGWWRQPRPGDIVLARVAAVPGGWSIKRIAAVRSDGYDLRGDSPHHSTDSRSFGSVPRRDIMARAIYRYAPPHRRGRPRR